MIHILSAPLLYALELTSQCNSRCPGCSNVFVRDKARRSANAAPLSARQWECILQQIRPHAELVKLTGGEPTLHPEFEAIVGSLQALGLRFSLFTNGRWQEPDRLVAFLQTVSQLRGLLVSLHGATPAAHEAYSGVPGSFAETIANIRRATQTGLNVAISTVIHRRNLGQWAEVARLAEEVGADHVVFNRYLGLPIPGLTPTDDELRQAAQEIDALREGGARVKFGNCIPQCFVRSSSTGCPAGVAYGTIDPWGYLRPCNHSPTRVANLLVTPLEEAWQSPAMEVWRELIPAACHSCGAFSQCHGGCKAMIEITGGASDPLMIGPLAEPAVQPPKRITLHEGLRPIITGRLRQERFGYVLLRGNRIAAITSEDYSLLVECDGRTTLRQVERLYGQRGLRLVVGLYQKNLLDLVDRAATSSSAPS